MELSEYLLCCFTPVTSGQQVRVLQVLRKLRPAEQFTAGFFVFVQIRQSMDLGLLLPKIQ